MATLLIVDDHAAVRAGVEALVAPEPDLRVVGAAADARTALEIAELARPDLALIDLHLPGEDGLHLCLRLDAREHRPRLIVYSAFADDLLAVVATLAGADGIVSKDSDPSELLAVLRATAAGSRPGLVPAPRAMGTVGAALELRDLPILGMLVHGTAPDEIAETLGLTSGELSARRWAILRRLSPGRERPRHEALAP